MSHGGGHLDQEPQPHTLPLLTPPLCIINYAWQAIQPKTRKFQTPKLVPTFIFNMNVIDLQICPTQCKIAKPSAKPIFFFDFLELLGKFIIVTEQFQTLTIFLAKIQLFGLVGQICLLPPSGRNRVNGIFLLFIRNIIFCLFGRKPKYPNIFFSCKMEMQLRKHKAC